MENTTKTNPNQNPQFGKSISNLLNILAKDQNLTKSLDTIRFGPQHLPK